MTSLSEAARRHLWMHFSRMGSYADHEIPVIRASVERAKVG